MEMKMKLVLLGRVVGSNVKWPGIGAETAKYAEVARLRLAGGR